MKRKLFSFLIAVADVLKVKEKKIAMTIIRQC